MPKVLIREYDNSTTGIPASNNFAVVVPGYFGKPEKNRETGLDYVAKDGLWNDSEVYEVTSQSDFVKYIGTCAGQEIDEAGPILSVVLYDEPDADEYSKFINKISFNRFEEAGRSNGEEIVYTVTEVTGVEDSYGHNGYLLKTIEYYPITKVQQEEGGVGVVDEEGNPVYDYIKATTPSTKTVRLTEVANANELTWEIKDGVLCNSTVDACIVKAGQEGTNAVEDTHLGNQIAYELLGLGYTVLYKKLDTATSALNQLSNPEFWTPLKDKSVFNFRYVMTGGCYEASVMNLICQLASFVNSGVTLEEAETYGKLTGRGDCIALCDINENITDHEVVAGKTLQDLIANIGYATRAISKADQYSAIFGPKVTYIMDDKTVEDFGNNKTFPASFHYLACAARTFERYNEWYAVAGYNRGISNYAIETTSVKLGEIAINTLAPRVANSYSTKSINLILSERGNYYLWGNRTGYALDNNGLVFHHFLNIRQLCCSIKKQLYTACRQFTFDPNSDLLWINFVNAIKPTLEAMKADQGIKGYTISRVANDKKALLTARIRIVPIEAVEDFDISIYLEDSLTGIVVSADEELA